MVDVSDVSVAYDRIFNFVVFRHHLIHFYLPCCDMKVRSLGLMGMVYNRTLQCYSKPLRANDTWTEKLTAWSQDLRATLRQMSSRARSFKYCVTPCLIFVPVPPAMPVLTISLFSLSVNFRLLFRLEVSQTGY